MSAITSAVQEYTELSGKVYKDVRVELIRSTIPQVVNVRQYDDSMPVIRVRLYSDNAPHALPEGTACNIRTRKPDGTTVYNPALGCSADRTIVYFEITQEISAVAGECPATVEINKDGVAGTSAIILKVSQNPVQNTP